MPKRLGNDTRLYVNTTGSTFVELKSQGSLTIERSTDQIDTSTKDTGAYKTSIMSQQALTLKQEGVLDVPDPALQAIYDASRTRAPIRVQVRDGDFSSTKVQFDGVMNVGNFNRGEPINEKATYSFDLVAAQAPTVDLLASA